MSPVDGLVTSTTGITVAPGHGNVIGHSLVVMMTSSELMAQGDGFVIVQRKVTDPDVASPVTFEVGELGVVIVAVPETIVQFPEPVPALLPANVVVVSPQSKVWSVPAEAFIGVFTVTV